jgi:superfamily II DNA/RNA helicase
LRHLLSTDDVNTAIIFANRKTTVREVNKSLQRHGFRSSEIHGDMDQASRIRELDRFKSGDVNILVASDVAARGLDVKGVSHVFNFDTPWHPDDYVHRIGRTGRAGAKGRAFTLVTPEDAEAIANVEKLTGLKIPVYEIDGSKAEARTESRDKPKREPREERRQRRQDPSQEKPQSEQRASEKPARKAEARKPAPRRPEPETEDRSEPGEWNGPMPDFLSISAL